MKARVLRNFKDLEENTRRLVGEVIEVSPERFAEINAHPSGVLIESLEPAAAEKPKPRRRKKAVKKSDDTGSGSKKPSADNVG